MASLRPSFRLFSLAPAPARVCIATPPSLPATRRSFFDISRLSSLLDSSPVNISVSRTLPYPPSALYRLVSDVDSYSQFVPFCEESKVTKWATVPAAADAASSDPVRVPVEAYLRVGILGVNEVFTSRLRCDPGVAVEALSGDAAVAAGASAAVRSGPLKSLVTKWTISPVLIPGTDAQKAGSTHSEEAQQSLVQLQLNYDFRDPAKNIAGRALSDGVAAKMIEAFEAQARRVIAGKDEPVVSPLAGLNIPAPIKAFAKSQLQKEAEKK
ncbi:hypothetical protein TD95_000320 [Thielaviopsis punctulata]|uniref:Coenzyme Q-binding protein COQ10 START domain-containing protein n=1 Tax=Thielaviopsis punctulata TaxID=72032 RepID=A0A0F4Z6R4_9PEZI|nr:hypothetical protein TD95_000320 [Thielaviopsis punctulata]